MEPHDTKKDEWTQLESDAKPQLASHPEVSQVTLIMPDLPVEASEEIAEKLDVFLNPGMAGMPSVAEMDYQEASKFALDYRELRTSIATDDLKELIFSLIGNFDRLLALTGVPHWATGIGHLCQSRFDRAVFSVTGKVELQLQAIDPSDHNQYRDKVIEEFRRLMSEPLSQRDDESLKAILENNFQSLAAVEPHLAPGLSSMLSAQIIGAYTAFETLAKDLWIAAVNGRPAKLGSRVEVVRSQQIPLTQLQQYDFNLKQHMGDLLEGDGKGKVRFDSIDSIRESYAAAFAESAFVKVLNKPELFGLSEVRNLLVHRSGIADRKFVSRMKSNSDWSHTPAGTILPLNGALAAKLTTTAVQCSIELARGVDCWLVANPE